MSVKIMVRVWAHSRRKDPEGGMKIIPPVIVEWDQGIDFRPRLFPLADTYEQAKQLEEIIRSAIERVKK